jgi:citrate lyase beta subunit
MAKRSRFLFTLMTNDPHLAGLADRAGVDRIGIDLDRIGKSARQPASYRISGHAPADLEVLRRVVRPGRLFARTDPLHPDSRQQIEELLARGVSSLMLPMFREVEEAAEFVALVAGRAEVVLLVETVAAAFRIDRIARLAGVDEIMIGLNDLHLDARLDERFEIVTSDLMIAVARTVSACGVRFGFGGLGRCDDQSLPLPSPLLYPQYARLGASSAIMARSFHGPSPCDLREPLSKARRVLAAWAMASPESLEQARQQMAEYLELSRMTRQANRATSGLRSVGR